jgi:hypothetical protein
MVSKLTEANQLVWSKRTDFKQHEFHLNRFSQIIDNMCEIESIKEVTHFILKRSILDDDDYWLDFHDILKIQPDAKLVVVYRDPRAAAYSAFKRDAGNLKQCAMRQMEQLGMISMLISSLAPEQYIVLGYDGLCKHLKECTSEMSKLCGIDRNDLFNSMRKIKIISGRNNVWEQELSSSDGMRLDLFFRRREAQWLNFRKITST